MKEMIADILPCASCGNNQQTVEVAKPEGRTADVYRVICTCGAASAMWSVTPTAAVRLWNRYMAEPTKK